MQLVPHACLLLAALSLLLIGYSQATPTGYTTVPPLVAVHQLKKMDKFVCDGAIFTLPMGEESDRAACFIHQLNTVEEKCFKADSTKDIFQGDVYIIRRIATKFFNCTEKQAGSCSGLRNQSFQAYSKDFQALVQTRASRMTSL